MSDQGYIKSEAITIEIRYPCQSAKRYESGLTEMNTQDTYHLLVEHVLTQAVETNLEDCDSLIHEPRLMTEY
jgi:hypothetical protein